MAMDDITGRPAPRSNSLRPLVWAQRNLFSSIGNTILTLASAYLLWLTIPPVLDFTIFSAVWTGTTREACLAPGAGMCWISMGMMTAAPSAKVRLTRQISSGG